MAFLRESSYYTKTNCEPQKSDRQFISHTPSSNSPTRNPSSIDAFLDGTFANGGIEINSMN